MAATFISSSNISEAKHINTCLLENLLCALPETFDRHQRASVFSCATLATYAASGAASRCVRLLVPKASGFKTALLTKTLLVPIVWVCSLDCTYSTRREDRTCTVRRMATKSRCGWGVLRFDVECLFIKHSIEHWICPIR